MLITTTRESDPLGRQLGILLLVNVYELCKKLPLQLFFEVLHEAEASMKREPLR